MSKEGNASVNDTTTCDTDPQSSCSSVDQQKLGYTRRRAVPAPPPAPRISSTIANHIRNLESQSNANAKCTSNDSRPLFAAVVTTGSKIRKETTDASCSSATINFKTEEQEVKPQPATPPPGLQSGSSSPYSPFENGQDGKEGEKLTKRQSAKEVMEIISSVLKTKEESLDQYRRKFHDLRKRYDTKKAELAVVHEHVKELRKKVEVLSQDKSTVTHSPDAQKQQLQGQVDLLKAELKKMKEELEEASIRASNLNSTLDYTKVALNGQKILYDMQSAKLAKTEKENAELKLVAASQETLIEGLRQRVHSLENAVKEDVNDKNMVVSAFNFYMTKTQARVKDIFGDRTIAANEGMTGGGNGDELPLSSSCGTIPQQESPSNDTPVPTVQHRDNDNNIEENTTPIPNGTIIKTERVSPEKNVKIGEGQKRKDTADDDEDDDGTDSDSVIFVSQKTNSSMESPCKKKQRYN